MKSILIIFLCVSILSCNNRANLKSSNKENNVAIDSIFSMPLIQDSLDSFIKSTNQYKVYTITCDEINGYKRLIFWAGKDIQIRIEDPSDDSLRFAGGIARKYEFDKIIAIDTISLRLLREIIDTTGFTDNLYIYLTNNDNADKLIVRRCRKEYRLIDIKHLEPM